MSHRENLNSQGISLTILLSPQTQIHLTQVTVYFQECWLKPLLVGKGAGWRWGQVVEVLPP